MAPSLHAARLVLARSSSSTSSDLSKGGRSDAKFCHCFPFSTTASTSSAAATNAVSAKPHRKKKRHKKRSNSKKIGLAGEIEVVVTVGESAVEIYPVGALASSSNCSGERKKHFNGAHGSDAGSQSTDLDSKLTIDSLGQPIGRVLSVLSPTQVKQIVPQRANSQIELVLGTMGEIQPSESLSMLLHTKTNDGFDALLEALNSFVQQSQSLQLTPEKLEKQLKLFQISKAGEEAEIVMKTFSQSGALEFPLTFPKIQARPGRDSISLRFMLCLPGGKSNLIDAKFDAEEFIEMNADDSSRGLVSRISLESASFNVRIVATVSELAQVAAAPSMPQIAPSTAPEVDNSDASKAPLSVIKMAAYVWFLVVANYFLQSYLYTAGIPEPHKICCQVSACSLLLLCALLPHLFRGAFVSRQRSSPRMTSIHPECKAILDSVEGQGKNREPLEFRLRIEGVTVENIMINCTELGDEARNDGRLEDFVSSGEVEMQRKVDVMNDRLEEIRGLDAVKIALDVRYLERAKTNNTSDLPYNWVEGANFDRELALTKWRDSLEWRIENNVDEILKTGPISLDKFFKIKSIWPQYFLGQDRDGNLVTLERFSGVDHICREFKRNGITPDDFASYCVFLNEYWIKRNFAPKGKLVKIMDVSGLSIGLSINLIVRYFGRMNKSIQQYPEILAESYFVNVEKAGAPFRILFKLLPNFLEPRTCSKIHQIKLNTLSGRKQIQSLVDTKLLPEDLAGQFKGDPLKDLPLEKEIEIYVRELISRSEKR